MTDPYPGVPSTADGNAYGATTYDTIPAGTSDSSNASTADVAKDQASEVKQGAADAGQQVAAVAKDQVGTVAAEAGSQAKDLIEQAKSELSEQASAQQKRLASGLRALGDELKSMSEHPDDQGVATDLARQASTRSHDAASWLDSREPGHLVTDLKGFARERPVAFLALAAGAGLLAGRLTRGVKDAGSDSSASASPSATVDAEPAEEIRPFATSQDGADGFPLSSGGL